MSDQNSSTEPAGTAGEQQPNEGDAATTEPSGTETAPLEGEAAPQANQEDELPDWAKSELKKVRGEAANYRTRLRDAEAKLTTAKTPEELEAAVAEVREQNAALEREVLVNKVARNYDLPDELAEVLRGATEAELTAHAEKLAKFVGSTPPGELQGGLDPSGDVDDELDPAKLAQRYGRGRRKRA